MLDGNIDNGCSLIESGSEFVLEPDPPSGNHKNRKSQYQPVILGYAALDDDLQSLATQEHHDHQNYERSRAHLGRLELAGRVDQAQMQRLRRPAESKTLNPEPNLKQLKVTVTW